MINNLAIQTLLRKMEQLMAERSKFLEKIDKEILELDAAIQSLSGGQNDYQTIPTLYDDEHPDYIKSSQEEI